MQIQKTNSFQLPFKAFITWDNYSGQDLKEYEKKYLNYTERRLNNKEAKYVDIIGEIKLNPITNEKMVRVYTVPLESDMVEIRKHYPHQNDTADMFDRKSRLFPLDCFFPREAIRFVTGQIKFYTYCKYHGDYPTKDPNAEKNTEYWEKD